MFQARDGARWFGSGGAGVYRFDGRALVRFTRAHGLGSDDVRSIQEDRDGNLFVYGEPGRVSRFDGRAFHALEPADPSRSEWRLHPDDLWFPGGQDTGVVHRWDGATLHRLAFPKTPAGEAHYAEYPRAQFPAMRYSPYDAYTVFRDGRGHVWFGTSTLGACRYDGTSFAWIDRVEIGLGANDSFGVRSIVEDRDGRFWFTNVMRRFDVRPAAPDERGPVALRYRREPGAAGAADPFSHFLSSVRDAEGVLWLATLGAGVWRWDGERMTGYPVTHEGSPIWIHGIHLDREGVLWVGTQAHGAYRFDGKSFLRFEP